MIHSNIYLKSQTIEIPMVTNKQQTGPHLLLVHHQRRVYEDVHVGGAQHALADQFLCPRYGHVVGDTQHLSERATTYKCL